MDYKPTNALEVMAVAMIAIYKGMEWLSFSLLALIWHLYQLTPATWPAPARLLIYPAASFAAGYLSYALKRAFRFWRTFR